MTCKEEDKDLTKQILKIKGEKTMLTKDEFTEKTKGYKSISEINYIKQYCGGKYTNFKLEPCYLEQTAWCDNTYYVDDERQLAIEDSFYIVD